MISSGILWDMKYGNRTTWQRIVRSPVTMILAIALFIILAKATWNIHDKASASDARLTQAQTELVQLEQRQTDLAGRVGYLSTDQGVESELRTKYLAVRQGESVDVIIESASNTPPATTTEPVVSEGWFSRFLHAIGL